MGGDADQGDHDSTALRDFYTDDLQLRSFVYLTIRSHRCRIAMTGMVIRGETAVLRLPVATRGETSLAL